MREFVYFVSYENGPVKIGKAKNISARIKTLQTGIPYPLQLLGVMAGRTGLEGALHRKFHTSRLNGEWFERDSNLLEFIHQNTSDPSALFYRKKYIEIDEAMTNLKIQFENRKQEIEHAARESLLKDIKRRLHEKISAAILSIVESHFELMNLQHDIENHRATYGDVNDAEKKVRNGIEKLFHVDWRMSRSILNVKELNEERIERMTEDWLSDLINKSFDSYISAKEKGRR